MRGCGQERPLGLFEVLARNRQSAVGRGRRTLRARETTTPNAYNTSSTTTAHYQTVGDTNMENCTRPNHHHHQNKTCNIRKREKRTIKTLHLSIKILQYLFLHKFVARRRFFYYISNARERQRERERESKSLVLVSLLPFRVLSSCFLLPLLLGERSEY